MKLKNLLLAIIVPTLLSFTALVVTSITTNAATTSTVLTTLATGSNATNSNATNSNANGGGSGGGGGGGFGGGGAINTQSSSKTKIWSGEWVLDSKGWWFKNSDGAYPKGSWAYIDYNGKKDWYYFDGEGYMTTGWQLVNGKWYYLYDKTSGQEIKGAMATGWKYINNKWYYLDNSGAMLTGWQRLGDKWYYLEGSGAMLKGWQLINDKWYYLYEKTDGQNVEGSMAENTTIGTYRVDGSGAWIQ